MRRREFARLTGVAAGAGLLGAGAGTASADPLDEIEILTTEYGESHVYVPDDADNALYLLSYGNGYVQARDRLFQMDVIRHVGYGNSAAVIGPAQLPSDIAVRRDLYSPEEISRQWAEASDTTREALRGYADGVNRKMVEMAAQGDLPGEFAALGHAPEPWEPEDSVAAINYLIGYFGVGGGAELSNAQSLARMTRAFDDEREAFEAYGDLNWSRITDDHYTTIPARDKTVDGGEDVPDYEDVPDEQLEYVDAALGAEPWGIETDVAIPQDLANGERVAAGVMEGFKWGSNALVASGEITETGRPMLGGGPQMGFFKPPIPYELGLHGAGFDMTGIGVPAAPALVIGRTDTLAWTVTSGRDDQVDTIAVDLDPDDRHRYRWDGNWHEMDTETVVHYASPIGSALAGETRVVEQEIARIEQDGAVMPVIAWNPAENVAWCQRTTTRYDELPGGFMWAELGQVDDLDEFEEGLAEFPFTFNFHVIEHDEETGEENIAYIHTGKVPERADRDYRLPATPGTHAWTEMSVGTGLGTHDRNPSRGYYANWNNGPAAGWRAGDGEQNWGSRHRVDQLDGFVRDALGVSEEVPDHAVPHATSDELSLDAIQLIIYRAARHDVTAQISVPYLARAALEADDPQLRAMGRQLHDWADADCRWGEALFGDGDGPVSHAGHTIYDTVRHHLQRLVFEDELQGGYDRLSLDPAQGLHADDHGNATEDVTFLDALAGDTTHGWFADATETGLTAPDADTRDAVIREALRATAKALAKRFESPEPADWRGEVHDSDFIILGATNPLSIPIMNRASYNQAIDLGAGIEGSRDVLPPANTGHVDAVEAARIQATGEEPDRLTDQLELYLDNVYKPHPHIRDHVEEAAVDTQTIRATPEHRSLPVEPASPPPGLDTDAVFPGLDVSGSG